MPRSGKFDVTDDTAGHVTGSRPIRKPLIHFRPAEKLFRRATIDQSAIEDKAPHRIFTVDRRISISDGTGAETIDENSLSAVSSGEVSAIGSQSTVVSKSGAEFQPEVQYRQVQRPKSPRQVAPLSQGKRNILKVNGVKHFDLYRSQPAVVSKSGAESSSFRQPEVQVRHSKFEPSGSLRDRWRTLNEEFKHVYQQRNQSDNAPPTDTSRDLSQGQTVAPKVNRYDFNVRGMCNLSMLDIYVTFFFFFKFYYGIFFKVKRLFPRSTGTICVTSID